MKNILYTCFLILPLLFTAQLNRFSDEWKNDKTLKYGTIGFCVINAKTSAVVSEHNSRQLMTPASTLKVVTTAAALNLLGADFRYETKIYYTGHFNKETGVLAGDIIIAGSGDPTLQSDNFPQGNMPVTDKWAKVLKDKGLKELRGNIIGDASCFDRRIPPGWIWEDISNYFGAVPCGLSYRDNKFKVFYNTAESGSEAKITGYSPAYLNTTITLHSDVSAKGTEDEAYAYGDPFSYTREIRGTLPTNKTNYDIEVALPDPALLCAENLYGSLVQAGVKCGNVQMRSNYKKEKEPEARQLIYTHYSPTLDKIVYFTNIKSNNHYCETLLKTLGKGSSETGLKVVKNFWLGRGLDSSEIYMEDASGLSRINAITPYYQASLLSKVFRDSTSFPFFTISLPLAGRQGSMNSIGKGSFIENNLRAKTGYITRVRAYCGYVRTKSGEPLVFSLIFNNYNCTPREARLKMEKFMLALGQL